jgi:hypothetical protein
MRLNFCSFVFSNDKALFKRDNFLSLCTETVLSEGVSSEVEIRLVDFNVDY